jgi:hypothetical protein
MLPEAANEGMPVLRRFSHGFALRLRPACPVLLEGAPTAIYDAAKVESDGEPEQPSPAHSDDEGDEPSYVPAECDDEDLTEQQPFSFTLTHDDMIFPYEIGAADWGFAGMMGFQRMIHERGTAEEKQRLRDLNLGYSG